MSIIFFLMLFGLSSVTVANEQFVEAAVGTTVTLPCRTDQNSSIVVWEHYPFGAILSYIVYLNGEVFDNYRGRVTVTGSRIGVYDLIILRVGLEESGRYTCTVGEQTRSLELIVLELYPSPQSCASNSSGIKIIGRNSCRIEPDIVSLNCTLRYQGNVQPVLHWNSTISNSVTSALKAIDSRTTISTVILKAGEQKSATYTCSVKYFNASLISRFSCTLDVNINTLINETREYNPECSKTSVTCLTNTTNECSYTWTDDKSVKIGSDSTLDLQSLQVGEYICTADCLIRQKHRCTLVPAKVNITCGTGKQSSNAGGVIAGVVIGVGLIVVIASLIAFLWIRNRRNSNQHRTGDAIETITNETSPQETPIMNAEIREDDIDAREEDRLNAIGI